MSNKNRRRLMLGVAAGHLILVALGAAGVSLSPLGPLGELLSEYSVLSGANSGYGFFAPGMGGQLRVRFDVIDGEGQKTATSLGTTASREVDLRVGDIINRFMDSDEEPALQRSLAASFAGKIFAHHPQARKVVVHLESFDPVSMEDFRRGARPQWTPLYEAKFVHHGRQTRTRESGDDPSVR